MKKAVICAIAGILAVLFCLLLFRTGNDDVLATGPSPYANNKKLIALTFDDGPGPDTDRLLTGLQDRGVKASFFLLGRKVEKNAAVVRRMKEGGHLIGSHTWNHERIQWRSREAVAGDLRRTDNAITAVCGEGARFFRPPHGAFFDFQLEAIDKIAIQWSYDTIDWKHRDAELVYQNILSGARDGAIILMHDIHKTTVDGVLRAIDTLKPLGFTFVRVDDLLGRIGFTVRTGRAYQGCAYGKKPRITHLPFVISMKHRPDGIGNAPDPKG